MPLKMKVIQWKEDIVRSAMSTLLFATTSSKLFNKRYVK